ncbi:hypothetical protein G6011_07734 [Alternaria panax]|uniref:Uncharacterized protein n=1 Tax=Alternaria panax TaxID=48097 RepID=A0AAD4I138_9PLEO|nr:hypothetical protein G6011_07734 [Alternaria panax]
MPPAKRQKTARDSGVFLEESGSESSDSAFESVRPNKNDKKGSKSKSSSSSTDKGQSKERIEPGSHDYICIPHPFFDVEGKNWLNWTLDPHAYIEDKSEVFDKLYKPIDDEFRKDGVYKAPPSEFPEHKWVMMWAAWLKADLLGRKAKYCDPDSFGLDLYTDWSGWGMQEILENMMIEFDQGFQTKEDRVEKMWSVISAVGLWLNEDSHVDALINNEDGETTCEIFGLLGCALLTVLAAIEAAGELKPDSRFLDLTLGIAYYLEISHDLPAYGIEGEYVAWRKEAVNYFKKGELDPEKGIFATKLRIEKLSKGGDFDGEKDYEETNGTVEKIMTGTTTLEKLQAERAATNPAGSSAENPVTIPEDDDVDKENATPEATADKAVPPPPTAKGKRKRGSGDEENARNARNANNAEKDPWHWDRKFKLYKKRQGGTLGGEKYDITKMSRADRAAASYTGKDPLAKIPVKYMKENLLDQA